MASVSVVFEWEQHNVPEIVYEISIASEAGVDSSTSSVYSSPWSVSLDYNIVYSATIIAANCLGEKSNPLIIRNIIFGIIIIVLAVDNYIPSPIINIAPYSVVYTVDNHWTLSSGCALIFRPFNCNNNYLEPALL